jgi:transposase
MADTPTRRARRQFTDEFKEGVVRLVLDDGKTVGAVARDMDQTETAVREWVKPARADRTRGRTGLTTAEREELARLRKEVREIRAERDILKKAAVGSRRRRNAGRQSISRGVIAQRLARTHVQTAGDAIELSLGKSREVGAVGKVLA